MFKKYNLYLILFLSIIIGLVFSSALLAQNWTPLPPYNILWPLWSSTLSPINPTTGLPTPLVNELASNTILPVQPAMGYFPYGYTWEMDVLVPWLFYNGPTGLLFFDPYYGINPFPPHSFINADTGAPIQITLPLVYDYPLPDLKESQFLVPAANLFYMVTYGIPLGIDPGSLLTFSELWGDASLLFGGGIPF